MLKSCLVAIAKDEDRYIDEWLEYHLKIGFDRIFVIRNNWEYAPNVVDERIVLLDDNSNDMYTQPRAYTTFLCSHCVDFEWMAFWDIDEFVVLKKHKNINDFLNDYDKFYAVGLNWRLFGDNGISYDKKNNSVLKRFTKCGKSFAPEVKTIVHTKLTGERVYKDIHHMKSPIGGMVNVMDTPFSGPFNNNDFDEILNVAYLNHYRTKTREECMEKCRRNDAGFSGVMHYVKNFEREYDKHNLNEVEDFSARDFLYGQQS